MARTPATHNDTKIAASLADCLPVAAIALELGVSQPTVYSAIKRLGLLLPGPTTRKPAKKPASPAKARTRRSRTNNASEAPAHTATQTAGVSIVPVADKTLLTVRVDKGIENLRNLSARIVRLERDLDAARGRYAETLATLALD